MLHPRTGWSWSEMSLLLDIGLRAMFVALCAAAPSASDSRPNGGQELVRTLMGGDPTGDRAAATTGE